MNFLNIFMRWEFLVACFLKIASIYLAMFCAQCTEKKSKCVAFENQVIFYMRTRDKQVAPRKQKKNTNVVSENILIMILSDGFLLN